MATFFNQATLNFGGSTTASNIVSGELASGITLTKIAVSRDYSRGDGITYLVTVTNDGAAPYNALTLTDDLGAFQTTEGGTAYTPLTYVDGSLLYFIDGESSEPPTAVADGTGLIISGITVPGGSTATLVYEALTNAYAPLESGATVTNTVTLSGAGIPEPVSATATVTARDEAQLSVAKAICPATVGADGVLTYTFIIQNSGNVAASGDDLFITDTFTPILRDISVTLDGAPLEINTGYTYDATTGEFATVGGVITVPAATFERDAASGIVSLTPGSVTVTVTGNAF